MSIKLQLLLGEKSFKNARYPNLSQFELLGNPNSNERERYLEESQYGLPHVFWSNDTWDLYEAFDDFYTKQNKMGNMWNPDTKQHVEKLKREFMESLFEDRWYILGLPSQEGSRLSSSNRYLKDFERYT